METGAARGGGDSGCRDEDEELAGETADACGDDVEVAAAFPEAGECCLVAEYEH